MSLLRDILKEKSIVNGKEQTGPRWKLTSLSPKEAAKKYGKKNVKVTKGRLRTGDDMVEVFVENENQQLQRNVTDRVMRQMTNESAEEKKHGRRKAGSWGRPKKELARQANKATRRLSKKKANEEVNEEATAGATAAHSIAVVPGGLGSEPAEKLPKAKNIWDKKKKKKRKMIKRASTNESIITGGVVGLTRKGALSEPLPKAKKIFKKKKRPMKESLLHSLILGEKEDPSFDQADVISKLKAAEKSADLDQDTVAFGLKDEEGKIIQVRVRAEEAEDFEQALSRELARVGEADEENDDPVSTGEIAEVLFKLKDQFEIVDVVWGEIPEDEEVEQGLEGEGEDLGTEGDTEGEDLGDEEMDDEMAADDEFGEEEDAKTALTQVIDMMKADSAAKQAEAEAKKAEAEAESAKYAAQASAAKVKQEEEILDMEAYNKAQADADKEAKTLAQLAKYKHNVAADGAEEEFDMEPEMDVDVEADVDIEGDVGVEDEEQTISTDDLMDLLRNRLAAN